MYLTKTVESYFISFTCVNMKKTQCLPRLWIATWKPFLPNKTAIHS